MRGLFSALEWNIGWNIFGTFILHNAIRKCVQLYKTYYDKYFIIPKTTGTHLLDSTRYRQEQPVKWILCILEHQTYPG